MHKEWPVLKEEKKSVIPSITHVDGTCRIQTVTQKQNKKFYELIKEFYKKHHIDHELFDFDDKLLIKAANYDLAITRSGASTISELCYLNIPFVAIPFPYAKDNHQYYNAEYYEKNNCCWLVMQKDINENNFTNLLIKIFRDQNEYTSKKENLIQFTKEYSWEKNRTNLIKLINENI